MGKHEISTGFEYMKRFLNVGQPPAASGAYGFDISATDQTVTSPRRQRLRLVPRWPWGRPRETSRIGYPNFTKDLFAAETSPYYAAFLEDTYHLTKLSPSLPACAGTSSAARPSGTTV